MLFFDEGIDSDGGAPLGYTYHYGSDWASGDGEGAGDLALASGDGCSIVAHTGDGVRLHVFELPDGDGWGAGDTTRRCFHGDNICE